MPFTTIVTGTTITSAWANASVRDQGVTPFADAAARTAAIATPVTGMVSMLTSSIIRLDAYNGTGYSSLINPAWGALVTWGPSIVQSASANTTINKAIYMRLGRLVICLIDITITGGATVAGNVITCSIPFAAQTAGVVREIMGIGHVNDVSAATDITAQVELATSTTVKFKDTSSIVATAYLGAAGAITAALANGDQIGAVFAYDALADA